MKKFYSLKGCIFPLELQLILACLRINPNEQEAHQIAQLSKAKINWPEFLFWVDRHRVTPLVYQNLMRNGGNGVPDSIMGALHSRFENNARRSLANAAELIRILKLFQDNGIECIPLKGSALAVQIYGNLALRHAGDIDIFINPNKVDLVDRLLRETYRRISPGPHLSPYQWKQYYRLREQLIYFHNTKKIECEIHTCLFYNTPFLFSDYSEIYKRKQIIMIGKYQVNVLNKNDMLLYLCDHGSQHYWHRMFWLTDLSEIILQEDSIDIDYLFEIALSNGLIRPLIQGYLLLNFLLNAKIPNKIYSYVKRDRMISFLFNASLRRIFEQDVNEGLIRTMYNHLIYLPKLYSNINYKIEIMKRVLFYSQDWGNIPLPDVLFPYFFILRPFMWLNRRMASGQGQRKLP